MAAPAETGRRTGRRCSVGLTVGAGLLLLAGAARFMRDSAHETFVNGAAPQTVSQRALKVACQGVDKKMKDRIASVEKTGKLTDAMRLVAAAKVRRSQDGVTKSRPFSDELQGMIKGLVKKLKGTGLEAELPMLKVPEKVNNVGIVMITSNRGLCGAYNTFLVKMTKRRILSLNEQGIVPKLVIIGKKGVGALKTRLVDVNLNYTGTFFSMPDTLTAKAANEISEEISALFLSGEVDKVEIHYTKFFNLLRYDPLIRSVLPLSPTGMESPEDETFKLTSEDGKLKVEKEKVKAVKAKEIENDVIFDQPPEVILNSMLPLYLNSQVLSLMFESQASELASRMNAMKTATDNAKDLKKRLTVAYNKKRQAGITQEICEISAGALALEDMDKNKGPKLGVFDNENNVESDFMKELTEGSIPDSPEAPFGPETDPFGPELIKMASTWQPK